MGDDASRKIARLRHEVSAKQRRGRRWAAAFGLFLCLVGISTVLLLRGGDQTPAPDEATPTAPQTAADPVSSDSFTVSTSGDLLIHSPVWLDALSYGDGEYDFSPIFKPIRRFLKEPDLAICHVETPITTGEPTGFPIFSAPAALAPAIRKAGWRACDTASNHSVDQGQAGINETRKLLDSAGVKHTGSFTSAKSQQRPTLLKAGPAKVGLLAYTDATNGLPLPSPWSVNVLPAAESATAKAEVVARDTRRLKAAGADAIIVNMQWGDENSTVPNQSQRELATAILEIDEVDAIAGQGPHVVQPIERINGKFVVFSSGNLLSNQGPHSGLPAETQDGLIALFRFRIEEDQAQVARVDYVPTWVTPYGHEILPAGLAGKTHPDYAPELDASWRRTVDIAGTGQRIKAIPRKPRG